MSSLRERIEKLPVKVISDEFDDIAFIEKNLVLILVDTNTKERDKRLADKAMYIKNTLGGLPLGGSPRIGQSFIYAEEIIAELSNTQTEPEESSK